MKKSGVAIMVMAVFLVGVWAPGVFAKKDKVELAYVEWACATASVNVVKEILEEKMDYDVDILPVSAAAMWQAIAIGDVDGMTTAWLPVTHKQYLDKVKGEVVNLGQNCAGAKIGMVVPKYVTIDSITELDANAAKFDNKIIGIDPGAGIMSKTEKAIEDYNLGNMTLMESSGAMMTATMKNKIRKKEWVVVTGWTPHWMFARWDLKYLKDPKGVYGGSEEICTVVRKGLKKDMPDVYRFLDNFHWNLSQIGQVMYWNAQGADPEDSAERWVKENPKIVEAWLK
ncbi:MAG: glycine betaine ABC transporter substrate-binding protein [Thermodesulfobacteriota bacterium]|nr:glycine betaine ABC transporter substrate-binding protein [Thermodesulfobacteriota bacterium]